MALPPRVLITGGTGFIGTNLTKRLVAKGIHVDVLSRRPEFALVDVVPDHPLITMHQANLTDEDALERAVRHVGAVFHLASNVNGTGDYAEDLYATESLIAVLENCKNSVERVVFGSSASVYGEGFYWCGQCNQPCQPNERSELLFEPSCTACSGWLVPYPTDETAALNGKSLYVRTKCRQEAALADFANDNKIGVTVLRFGTVYGPGQSIHNSYGWLARCMLTGAPVHLVEDGLQTRDFIYVEDITALGLRALADNNDNIKIVNVGTGVDTSIVDFFKLMAEVASTNLGITHPLINVTGVYSPDDTRHCRLDCGRMEDSFNFVPSMSLRTGMANWLHFINNALEHQLV